MEVIFHVRNFGKIKSADVNISNFALFVGNNNSGKTLLMELIYAVLDEIQYLTFSQETEISYSANNYLLVAGVEEISKLNQAVNDYLKENLSSMVQRHFNSNTLTAEEVSLDFVMDKTESYRILLINRDSLTKEDIKDILCKESIEVQKFVGNEIKRNQSASFGAILRGKYTNLFWCSEKSISEDINRGLVHSIIGATAFPNMLFLPAARTGFMMTYRSFFSKKSTGRNVTTPIRDFLEFLQEYSYYAISEADNQHILNFIYENMLDGKIEETGDSTYYVPKGTNNYVPLMLASSMVNELVPIAKMLTHIEPCAFLFYDEVETSMHPSKQMEMVRLLNRLNNSGMKMIVSTHSDAMARKINNMLLLQHADRPFEEIQSALKKKGITLEKEDLLKGDIHVYQFTNGDDGMSTVEELEFREMPLTGYDFPQFMDSALDLYEEAKTVMGLDDEN